MTRLDNWRLHIDWIAVYEPDDCWEVRLVDACVEGDTRWQVQLFCDDDPHTTIADEITEPEEACNTLVEWLLDHRVIIT